MPSAWRCKNAVNDSWLRASSVASFCSSSPRLLARALASPPHSLSSGAISWVPSPSQLTSSSAPSGVVVSSVTSDVLLDCSTVVEGAISATRSPRLTCASTCSRPKSSRSAASWSTSKKGLASSICSISWLSSSVESCRSRIDCCNWGVSARCWEIRRERPCFMRLHMRKFSPKYTRRTSGFCTISSGVPCASTVPSLMM